MYLSKKGGRTHLLLAWRRPAIIQSHRAENVIVGNEERTNVGARRRQTLTNVMEEKALVDQARKMEFFSQIFLYDPCVNGGNGSKRTCQFLAL